MERWACIHAFAYIYEDKFICACVLVCDLLSANLFL